MDTQLSILKDQLKWSWTLDIVIVKSTLGIAKYLRSFIGLNSESYDYELCAAIYNEYFPLLEKGSSLAKILKNVGNGSP